MVQISEERTPPAKSEAKKAEILRRAAAAFREQGFHGAGMREIAATLGMTPGSLYYYFQGKDDLLYSTQQHALDRLLEGAKRVAETAACERDRLKAMVRAHVLCLLDETGGSAANLEFRSLPPPLRAKIAARRDAYERVVRATIARGIKGGELRAVDPKLAVLGILGAANSSVVWFRPDGPKSAAEIADAFADTLVDGLAAPAAGAKP